MTNSEEQNAKREYFKLLLQTGNDSYSSFNSLFRNFYLFSLIFFTFTLFKTSEINLFGAKVQIPQEWITAIAPLVLSFLYYRLIYLYQVQLEYTRMVTDFFPTAISGGNWTPSDEQIDRVLTPPSLGLDPSFMMNKSIGFTITFGLSWIVLFIIIFLLPIVFIVYYIYLLWQLQYILIVIGVTICSIIFVLFGLIMSIYALK